MLRSKLTIAGSNFIFNHINENYNEYLDRKKKLRVIFRGINLDYYNQKNISILKQEKIKKEWGLPQNQFIILKIFVGAVGVFKMAIYFRIIFF